MSDEYPTPSRTVSVDEAVLLRDQLDHSEEEAENADNEIEKAYHESRVEATEAYLTQIEDGGLDEAKVRDQRTTWLGKFDAEAEENPEDARYLAKKDAAKQVLEQYFGDDEPTVVDLGDITSSSELTDGTILVNGMKRNAELTVSSTGTARAMADLFLGQAGESLEDMQATTGRPL